MNLTEEEKRGVVNGVLQRRFGRSDAGGLTGFARRHLRPARRFFSNPPPSHYFLTPKIKRDNNSQVLNVK
jgi:hypothetical protein